jgi:glycosyltransferase involved in cell wall biosynthesis
MRAESEDMNRDKVPLTVVMLALNEAHNMVPVLENISGWAEQILLVDSYSSDATVDIALRYRVRVFQRAFRGFGEQRNFAVKELPITTPWTMQLDPDERLTDELKRSIAAAIDADRADAFVVRRRLWFMGKPLSVRQPLIRVWRTGTCRFSDVLVNEHPLVCGRVATLSGDLEHHDSPNLHHWIEKQNLYSTFEAIAAFRGNPLSDRPRLLGTALQRRMWLKRNFSRIPLRYVLLFLYCYLIQGAWRAGFAGVIWSRMRIQVYRQAHYKLQELNFLGTEYQIPVKTVGQPDTRVPQYE